MSEHSSALASITVPQLLEAVATNDPRWAWMEQAWGASEHAATRELAVAVRAHRQHIAEQAARECAKIIGAAPAAEAREPEPSPDGSLASSDDDELSE